MRLHDLEDLLVLGMKNYEARRSRSCSQGADVGMPFAESSLIRMLLDSRSEFLSSGVIIVAMITDESC
jgi:hypothetical protein